MSMSGRLELELQAFVNQLGSKLQSFERETSKPSLQPHFQSKYFSFKERKKQMNPFPDLPNQNQNI